MISHPKHCLVLVVGSRPSHPGCASLDFVNNSMMSFTGAGVAAKKMAPIWPWIGRAFRCDGTDCDAVLPDSMEEITSLLDKAKIPNGKSPYYKWDAADLYRQMGEVLLQSKDEDFLKDCA